MSYSKVGSNLPYPNATTAGLFLEKLVAFKAEKVVVLIAATKEAFGRYFLTDHVIVNGVEFLITERLETNRFRAEIELDMFFSGEELTLRARVLQALEDSRSYSK